MQYLRDNRVKMVLDGSVSVKLSVSEMTEDRRRVQRDKVNSEFMDVLCDKRNH